MCTENRRLIPLTPCLVSCLLFSLGSNGCLSLNPAHYKMPCCDWLLFGGNNGRNSNLRKSYIKGAENVVLMTTFFSHLETLDKSWPFLTHKRIKEPKLISLLMAIFTKLIQNCSILIYLNTILFTPLPKLCCSSFFHIICKGILWPEIVETNYAICQQKWFGLLQRHAISNKC